MSSKRAAVLGAGISGQGATRLLVDEGFEVAVFDQREASLPGDVEATLTAVPDPDALAQEITSWAPDFLVVSPGVPPHSPILGPVEAAGIEVFGEVELAWRNSLSQAWLCITGTNGKTTTVKMLASILSAAGDNVIAAGNVGFAVTEKLARAADILPVELSSAQLATSFTVAPTASICLNVDVDHVDWHGSAEDYWKAKASVYNNTRVARLYFADDPVVRGFAEHAEGAEGSSLVPLTFGQVEWGEIGIVGGKLIDGFTAPNGGTSETMPEINLMDVPLLAEALKLKHGAQSVLVRDALAAAGLALSFGVTLEEVLAGLKSFVSEPHRMAFVDEIRSVSFVNDSKATNVHAAKAALDSFDPSKVVWVVGGDPKGQDLTALIEQFGGDVRGAVVIGKDQNSLLETFVTQAPHTPVSAVKGEGDPRRWMGEVVRASMELAEPGDTVLLAPACASWDQFDGYEQRGNLFAAAVGAWSGEQ